MNTLESVKLADEITGYIGYILSESLQIGCNSELVIGVQTTLYESVNHQPVYETASCHPEQVIGSSMRSGKMVAADASPRSISGSCKEIWPTVTSKLDLP